MMQLLDRENYHELKRTSIHYSYPEWLVEYWIDHYGQMEAEKLMYSLNGNPYTFLRINQKIDRMQAAKELNLKQEESQIDSGAAPELAQLNFRLSSLGSILDSQLFYNGLITVQDISSQIAVRYFSIHGPEKRY
ncbi:MAG: hypothetical protein U5N58_10630 [Actinomycetota bacterium]|nr:hypothetical protein [Actinomycetota bacterium]